MLVDAQELASHTLPLSAKGVARQTSSEGWGWLRKEILQELLINWYILFLATCTLWAIFHFAWRAYIWTMTADRAKSMAAMLDPWQISWTEVIQWREKKEEARGT